ncbi:MAG: histidine--tRNA ligase, partial [Bacilli bacterium]|nr:histidine--tRNA ligase [Bacilli bacterium]
FSIGFERLILLLNERGFEIPRESKKLAIILNHEDQKEEALKYAQQERKKGSIVKVLNRSKNLKHQIDVLEESGYTWKEW